LTSTMAPPRYSALGVAKDDHPGDLLGRRRPVNGALGAEGVAGGALQEGGGHVGLHEPGRGRGHIGLVGPRAWGIDCPRLCNPALLAP
jgi:hypothetical protein